MAARAVLPLPADLRCAGCGMRVFRLKLNTFKLVELQVLSCDVDLLHPPQELEKRKHKLKRLVASPNSYFMDVKCQGCFVMYVSHAQLDRRMFNAIFICATPF